MKSRFIETDIGTEIRCAKCREYWPSDDYSTASGRKHSYCKVCFAAYQKSRRKRALRAIRQEARAFVHAIRTGQTRLAEKHFERSIQLEARLN